jgi:hypothetical protein
MRYEITNVRKSPVTAAGHRHIVAVKYDGRVRDVDMVYYLILSGSYDFYTYSPSTGKTATVHTMNCCGLRTLRSAADAVRDNNLDNLPPC